MSSNTKPHQVDPVQSPSQAAHLFLVNLPSDDKGSSFRFISSSELSKLTAPHSVLYKADFRTGALAHVQDKHENIELPRVGARAFLKGIEVALNKIDVGAEHSEFSPEADSIEPSFVSNEAMDAATDALFDLMEQNIDRWTYDASSLMLSSLALQDVADMTMRRREAAEIQVKSNIFNSEFRAFLIESLVNFKCNEPIRSADSETTLELVSSDVWKSHNIEPLLAREYEGQTKIEFGKLNRRMGEILNRNLSPEENTLGPKSIAWTIAQALNQCGYSKRQRDILEPIMIADFNVALEKLYRHINQIWIDMGILPEAKLEILKSDVA